MAKVLVVEDSPTQQKIISTLLKNKGFTVQVANDGIEALEYLQQFSPDLVVLDVVMPRMNGYELCRHLKADPNRKHLPIVMCSSKSEDFDRHWAMKQGADAYICKPFQAKELLGTIKRLLRRDRIH